MTHMQIIHTTSGPLVGTGGAADGVERFLGIPFAEPPVGALRFKPPVAKAPWHETLQATRFGAASMQVSYPGQDISEYSDDPAQYGQPYFGSEDCLSLNIWRPAAPLAEKRPLFIWVHGGANHLEGSRSQHYDGTELCRQGDIVFASVNYRLGPFGFLDVSALGGLDYRGSSCNGLRDQLLGIEWILDNAAAFGADPGNVTIAGESAGGMDISWLLASGRLKGRIKRAILMSNVKGPAGFGENPETLSRHDPQFSQTIARDLLQRLDFKDFADFREASGDTIFARIADIASAEDAIFSLDALFYPCADETFSPLEPFRAVRGGALDGIDLMIGYTNYEAGLWLTFDPGMLDWPAQKMADRFGNLAPGVKAEVVGAYRGFYPGETEGELGIRIMSDCGFVAPITWFAEEAATAGSRVWLYRFDWEVDERLKAMHAADLPFFFARPNDAAAAHLIGDPADDVAAEERARLGRIFSRFVLSFARYGDPNAARDADAPDWPTYELATRPTMRLAPESRVAGDPDAERRQWWTERVYRPVMGPAAEHE